jgi:hypothetical protein
MVPCTEYRMVTPPRVVLLCPNDFWYPPSGDVRLGMGALARGAPAVGGGATSQLLLSDRICMSVTRLPPEGLLLPLTMRFSAKRQSAAAASGAAIKG